MSSQQQVCTRKLYAEQTVAYTVVYSCILRQHFSPQQLRPLKSWDNCLNILPWQMNFYFTLLGGSWAGGARGTVHIKQMQHNYLSLGCIIQSQISQLICKWMPKSGHLLCSCCAVHFHGENGSEETQGYSHDDFSWNRDGATQKIVGEETKVAAVVFCTVALSIDTSTSTLCKQRIWHDKFENDKRNGGF